MSDKIKNIQSTMKVSEEKWNKIFKKKKLPNKQEPPKEQPSEPLK